MSNYIPDLTELFPEGMRPLSDEEPTEEQLKEEQLIEKRRMEEYNKIAIPPSDFATQMKSQFTNEIETAKRNYVKESMERNSDRGERDAEISYYHYGNYNEIRRGFIEKLYEHYNLSPSVDTSPYDMPKNTFSLSAEVRNSGEIKSLTAHISSKNVFLQLHSDLCHVFGVSGLYMAYRDNADFSHSISNEGSGELQLRDMKNWHVGEDRLVVKNSEYGLEYCGNIEKEKWFEESLAEVLSALNEGETLWIKNKNYLYKVSVKEETFLSHGETIRSFDYEIYSNNNFFSKIKISDVLEAKAEDGKPNPLLKLSSKEHPSFISAESLAKNIVERVDYQLIRSKEDRRLNRLFEGVKTEEVLPIPKVSLSAEEKNALLHPYNFEKDGVSENFLLSFGDKDGSTILIFHKLKQFEDDLPLLNADDVRDAIICDLMYNFSDVIDFKPFAELAEPHLYVGKAVDFAYGFAKVAEKGKYAPLVTDIIPSHILSFAKGNCSYAQTVLQDIIASRDTNENVRSTCNQLLGDVQKLLCTEKKTAPSDKKETKGVQNKETER